MLDLLFSSDFTADRAIQYARWLWSALAIVWLVMAFANKSSKRSESLPELLQHIIPIFIAFSLLFGTQVRLALFGFGLLPQRSEFWWTGLFLTAMGVAISIWARLSLGSNWSGTVTLKTDHELIRKGLYSRIRHPIYTGLLVAALGSGMIRGQLRDLLAFLILYATFYFKARREESFLLHEFGPAFTAHQQHTGMFWPKLS